MAQPPRYERKKDFADDYADNTDHVALNAELDGVAQTTDAIRENLALLQRDDGALKNGIVTADSLDQGLLGDIVVAVSGDIDDKVQQATAAATDSVNASINSQNAADNSQGYAEQSLSSAGSSQASAQNAATSRDRAQEWAEKLSGPVTGDLYSAHYWADQAKFWAAGPAESISVVPSPIQPEINVQAAVDRLANAAIDYADATEPVITWPYMTWADTGNMLLKRRNAANDDWVNEGPLLDYHYTRGNILGPVSVDPNKVPTGALIQSAATSSGWINIDASGWAVATRSVAWPAGSSGGALTGGIGAAFLPGWVVFGQVEGVVSATYGASYVVETTTSGASNFAIKVSTHLATTIQATGALTLNVFAIGRVF